ncbi:hypothetical protein [Streptomyces sp. NPDC095613]|uniref:hypothetical protein n=1 Tax=Streptomyces sp. NPDC095613 TaxID=3155540 RepID=UPI0033338470
MDRLRRRSRARTELRICDDDELRSGAAKARRQAERARIIAEASPGDEVLSEEASEAEAERKAAQTALDNASEVLTFLALPRPVLEELIAAHPPTDAQAQDGAVFNADTFPAALISAASLDGMSEEEAAELLATWSAADANLLWEAAWQVQQESRADLGKG